MSIRKLSRTAGTRKEMSAEEWKQILNSMEAFDKKPLSSDQLQRLQYKENCYPVIPVPNKCLLLAVHSTRFTGLVWLSNWFLVDSTYRDKYNEYHVRLSVNGSLVDVDYDLLYPKEVTKISKYGLIFNPDHADAFSRYLFRCITKLEIEEQYCGMGFMMKEEKLQFIAYEEGAKILQYTRDVPLEVYTEGLNRLLTNTAVMFALCCSCASLFLAYLSIQCGMALQSFIISFYGRTTTGKSTAQALMASVFTNPNDKKIYIPFFGTLNAIVRNFAQKFGIPQIFDEATVSSGVNMENLFYTVTLEQDKSRCNTNADLRESDTWKLIMITSSECRLLTDAHMHNKGLDARLLSFELAFTDSREHSEKIHDFCGKQYGILGKRLSEYLLEAEPETIQAKYEECRTAMRDAIPETEYFDLTERLINEYALLLLAARVLSDHGVAMDVEGITAILTENHGSIREKTNVADKYYQHLVTYAAMHPYQEGIKKNEANHTVAFIDELCLRILSEYGASNTDLVVKELDAAGYLLRRKKNALKNRQRFNGTLVNCYEIILPDEGTGDDDCMTLEFVLTHYEGLDEA